MTPSSVLGRGVITVNVGVARSAPPPYGSLIAWRDEWGHFHYTMFIAQQRGLRIGTAVHLTSGELLDVRWAASPVDPAWEIVE